DLLRTATLLRTAVDGRIVTTSFEEVDCSASNRVQSRRMRTSVLQLKMDDPMRPVALAALVAALLPFTACRASPPRPRLVLLYATCTLNRDHVAPYGKDARYTPHLSAFARESVVF